MSPDTTHPTPVVAPAGALDLTSSRSLATELAELAGAPGDAVLDLSDVGFMDSVGLGVVLKAVQRFKRQGKLLVLVVPAEGNVRRLLQLSRTEDQVTAEHTREGALARANAAR